MNYSAFSDKWFLAVNPEEDEDEIPPEDVFLDEDDENDEDEDELTVTVDDPEEEEEV